MASIYAVYSRRRKKKVRWQRIFSFAVTHPLPKHPRIGLRPEPHRQPPVDVEHLAEPIRAAAIYRSGILVQVPRPERYAIHKLIVADRRRDGAGSLKSAKDREQAAFLIEALAQDRPDDLRRAYAAAMEVGPRWREHMANSLRRMERAGGVLDRI